MLPLSPLFSSLHYSTTRAGAAVIEVKIDKKPKEYGYIYENHGSSEHFVQNSEELREIVAQVASLEPSLRRDAMTYNIEKADWYNSMLAKAAGDQRKKEDAAFYLKNIHLGLKILNILLNAKRTESKRIVPKGDLSFYGDAFDKNVLRKKIEGFFGNLFVPTANEANTTFTYRQGA